ncbi:hypothetical protein [Candidatus Lokiarchaeum ossiferum]|uniref:hypothetical protein n=1 Tax=Candidatus Lokiarchaeum ossiferum TaxID=2951803 RepID=UPI00352D918D
MNITISIQDEKVYSLLEFFAKKIGYNLKEPEVEKLNEGQMQMKTILSSTKPHYEKVMEFTTLGISPVQIATLMGKSESQVYQLLHYARSKKTKPSTGKGPGRPKKSHAITTPLKKTPSPEKKASLPLGSRMMNVSSIHQQIENNSLKLKGGHKQRV